MYSRRNSTPLPLEHPLGAMSISMTFWNAFTLSPQISLISAAILSASSRLSVWMLT